MKNRPWILIVTALALVCIALSIPVQVMMIYGHGFTELPAVAAKLTPLNYLIILLGAFTAGLVVDGSPLIRIAVPILLAVVAVNNFAVGFYATDFSMLHASLATLGFAAINVPLLHPDVRVLLRHPERRWWRQARRKRAAVPVFLGGCHKGAIRTQTFDVSETGVFVPVAGPNDLKLDETVSICLTVGVLSQVRCSGRVVRFAEAKGAYPRGVGVEFVGLAREHRRELKRFIERSPEL